jgi:hypothetical protein
MSIIEDPVHDCEIYYNNKTNVYFNTLIWFKYIGF